VFVVKYNAGVLVKDINFSQQISSTVYSNAVGEISVKIPATMDFSLPVEEYDIWVEPTIQSSPELTEWEDVPFLYSELNQPITIAVHPSDAEHVKFLMIQSDNYQDLYLSICNNIHEFDSPLICSGSGIINMLGDSTKEITIFNMGESDANIHILVCRLCEG